MASALEMATTTTLQFLRNWKTLYDDPAEIVLSRKSLGKYDLKFVTFWQGRGHAVTRQSETIHVKMCSNPVVSNTEMDLSDVVDAVHDLDNLYLTTRNTEEEAQFGECVLRSWKRVIDDASLKDIAGRDCDLSTLLSTCFLVGKITGQFCQSEKRPSFFQTLLDVYQESDDVQKIAMTELVRVQERSLFMSKSIGDCLDIKPRHRLTLLKYALLNIDSEYGDFDDALKRLSITNDHQADSDAQARIQEQQFSLHVLFYWHALVRNANNEQAQVLVEEVTQMFEANPNRLFQILEMSYRNCVQTRQIVHDLIENAECHMFMRHVNEFGSTELADKFTLLKYYFQHKVRADRVSCVAEFETGSALSDYIVSHLSDLDPVGVVAIFEKFDSTPRLTLRHIRILLDHFCAEKPWIVKTLFQNYQTTMHNSASLTWKERRLIEHYLELVVKE